jgi:hypothetical protein
MNDRQALLRDIVVAGVRAGDWSSTDALLAFAERVADRILGPAPMLDRRLAEDLDRALTQVGKAAPAVTTTAATDTEVHHDTVTAEGDGGGVSVAQTRLSPPSATGRADGASLDPAGESAGHVRFRA